jgi:hypothetical protein
MSDRGYLTGRNAGSPETGLGGGHHRRVVDALYGAAASDLDEMPPATHWPSIPAIEAAEEWDNLRAWVKRLQDRFDNLDHHVIPACWWRHNEHVEALVALRDHERVSFSDTAPATAPLDWIRALRDVTALLRAWTAELACGATHQDPPSWLPPLDIGAWDAHVVSDVARRQQASGAARV